MKRSEFRELRRQRPGRTVNERWLDEDCEAAEAAGVVWDPEEPKLPERLQRGLDGGSSTLWPGGKRGWAGASDADIQAGYDAAVYRYNVWEELRKHAGFLVRVTPDGSSANDGARQLVAILDGKEGA